MSKCSPLEEQMGSSPRQNIPSYRISSYFSLETLESVTAIQQRGQLASLGPV